MVGERWVMSLIRAGLWLISLPVTGLISSVGLSTLSGTPKLKDVFKDPNVDLPSPDHKAMHAKVGSW